MQNSIKLFLITIKNGAEYYVVSTNPTSACLKLENFLEDNDWHHTGDRGIIEIKFLANQHDTFDGSVLIVDDIIYNPIIQKYLSEIDKVPDSLNELKMAYEGCIEK